MRYLVVLLVLFGFAGIAHAEPDESIHEPFEYSDVVLIGEVIQVNTLENKTQYDIQVEEYLKGQTSFDMITAMLDGTRPPDFPNQPLDYYNKPYFEAENQVLVYLKQQGGTFHMSSFSFTIKKPTYGGPPNVIHPTGPDGYIHLQGDEIVISGAVKKGYLYGLEESGLDSSFNLVVLDENENQIESEKLAISPDGDYRFSFQKKNELRTPGKYSWEITFENGSMGGEFVVVPDLKHWTPLKQFRDGVSRDDIKCREGLVLIQRYDGTPACVTLETSSRLVERGWTNHESFLDANRQEILSRLREGSQGINGALREFVVSEALKDRVLSGMLSDVKYQTSCCAYMPDNSDRIAIMFQSDQKQTVITAQYDLIQEKIAKIETNPIINGKKATFEKNPQEPQNTFTTIKPNSMTYFYYPNPSETNDKFKLFMLIRLPEWMGGAANDTSAFRAYSAKSLDDPCIVKYWPNEGRQDIENPCQGAMYRTVDGAMTYGTMYSSTAMTALPHLDLSMDYSGMLHVEPPKFTKTENGVVGYGRDMTMDEIRNGSKFLIESFAGHYPDYPQIPLEFAGYLLSDIMPEKYLTTIKYLDFQGDTGYITMTIDKQGFGRTGNIDFTESNKEFWQVGNTVIKIGNINNYYKSYRVQFQTGHNYFTIEGNSLEPIKRSIIKNYFPGYSYDDLFLVSKTE